MATFNFKGTSYDVKEGETLFDAMERHKVSPEVKCGGVGQCGECVVKVISGREHFSEMTLKETQLLGNVFFITKERLGCQCFISGDVEIELP